MIGILIAVFVVYLGIVALATRKRGVRVAGASIFVSAAAYLVLVLGLVFYVDWAASYAIYGDPFLRPLTMAAGMLVSITLLITAPMLTVQRLCRGSLPGRAVGGAGTTPGRGTPSAGAP